MVKFKTENLNQASVKCKLAHLTCSSAAISPVDLGGQSAGEKHFTISAPSAGLRWFSATERSICMHNRHNYGLMKC